MKQLFQAVSRSSEGAFIINDQQQIIFWNQAAQKLLGYSAKEIINHPCYEVLCGLDEKKRTVCQRHCRIASTILQGGSPPNMDVLALTKSGERRWINVTTLDFPNGDVGSDHAIVHIFRDATQKKSNERFIEEIMAVTREIQTDNSSKSTILVEVSNGHPDFDILTSREREVLLLLAHGLATDEIASTLSISLATSRNHIQSILEKLGVHSRLEAVAYAYQNGLVETTDP